MTTLADRITHVQRSVDRLAAEVRVLRVRMVSDQTEALRRALRRRGLVWKKVLHDGALMPRGAAAREEFYQLLRHYSFRLFLRDVIKHAERFTAADLVRYCSPGVARRYLSWLVDRKLVQVTGRRFRLTVPASSFGPTLEWFVAMVLEREYGVPSAWNIRFDASASGGDYDVIGFQDGACIYIETKSSPPRNIEQRQVHAFLDRLETLRPDVAVFLNDTQLRMGDKIAVLFAAELSRRLGRGGRRARVERLTGEIFIAGDRLFIANSDPDLAGNLGLCLAHYFRLQGIQFNGIA